MTHLKIIAHCVLLLAGTAASTMTMAQTLAPSAATAAAAEKAQKETDRTMYWIRVLATTPAAKPAAAPKPVAAVATVAQARQVASAERVRVAAAAPAAAQSQTYTDGGAAVPSNGVTAPSDAKASSLAANGSTTASGGLDASIASAGLAGSLAAPSATAAQIDVPAEQEPADPGLVMIGSADPEFPASTMKRLRKGSVEVKFEVNTDGVVTATSITASSHPSLNAAAIEAVRQWRFQPTYKGHTALVDLKFDLDS